LIQVQTAPRRNPLHPPSSLKYVIAIAENPLIAVPCNIRKNIRVSKLGLKAAKMVNSDANSKETPMIFFRPQAFENIEIF
jgi:hypothetical protein